MRSSIRYPLDSFDAWLSAQGYACGTRAGMISRVRTLLTRMTDGETLQITPERLETQFKALTVGSEASARVAWNAYTRFSSTQGCELPSGRTVRPDLTPIALPGDTETFLSWLQGQGLRDATAIQYNYRMTALLKRLNLQTPERAAEVLLPGLFDAVSGDLTAATANALRCAWNAYLGYCGARGLTVEYLPDARIRGAAGELPGNAPAVWAVLQKLANRPTALPAMHALTWPEVSFRTSVGTRAEHPRSATSVTVRDGAAEYGWSPPLDGWRALWASQTGPRVFEGWSLDQLHALVAKGRAGRVERLAREDSGLGFERPPMVET